MTPKLTAPLLMSFWILTGCSGPAEVTKIAADFCAIEEQRKFSQEEWDWRAAHAPWNLRRDVKTNTAYEREECATYLERTAQ